MVEYFDRAKRLQDRLAASGEVVCDSDVQNILLNGLDSVYDAIVTTLTARLNDIEMDEFQSHLFAFEMRLEAQNLCILCHTPTTNIATQHRNGGRYNQAWHNNHSQVRYNHPHNRLNNFQSRSYNRYGQQSGQSNYSLRPCNICGRKNHNAAT
ncbi:hypothetical protein IFM89_002202 [Coptis chinensis]|uniref:Uncharacterized protein n=1 Tax=Coptis chinensis TaxID=261450 RepID=A0A835I887_9MAGN|nr:hypothetical protein IFM89_002202 [Coptis chinensis]